MSNKVTKKANMAPRKFFSRYLRRMSLKKITIVNTTRGVLIPRAKITRAVTAACSELKKATTVNVIFVSDKKISNLHRIFLHDASPTDVLSFVLQEDAGVL